jgi:hypothetical protein
VLSSWSFGLISGAVAKTTSTVPYGEAIRTAKRSLRPTTTTTNFTTPRSPQMEPIDAALTAIEALEPGEKLVYTQIAKRSSVNRITLARRHQGLTTSRAIRYQNQQALRRSRSSIELSLSYLPDQSLLSARIRGYEKL